MNDMSLHEIYSNLLAGEIMQIEFASVMDVNVFRSRLSVYKSRQEEVYKKIGMLDTEDKTTLTVTMRADDATASVIATVRFFSYKDRAQRTYKILSTTPASASLDEEIPE